MGAQDNIFQESLNFIDGVKMRRYCWMWSNHKFKHILMGANNFFNIYIYIYIKKFVSLTQLFFFFFTWHHEKPHKSIIWWITFVHPSVFKQIHKPIILWMKFQIYGTSLKWLNSIKSTIYSVFEQIHRSIIWWMKFQIYGTSLKWLNSIKSIRVFSNKFIDQ